MAKNDEINVPKSQGIIKGKPDLIPAELLNKSRNSYNWNDFEVGDHREFTMEEAPKARSSVIAFAKGTKERPPRNFSTRTVTRKDGDREVKIMEVWRLPDSQPVASGTNQSQTTAKATQH
jgi:hypothetical protein